MSIYVGERFHIASNRLCSRESGAESAFLSKHNYCLFSYKIRKMKQTFNMRCINYCCFPLSSSLKCFSFNLAYVPDVTEVNMMTLLPYVVLSGCAYINESIQSLSGNKHDYITFLSQSICKHRMSHGLIKEQNKLVGFDFYTKHDDGQGH